MAEHGSAGVSCAAKGAGGYGLDAIEELESGAGGEESDGVVDDGFVGSVEAGDVARKDEQGDAHAAHERGTEDNGGISGEARGDRVTASDGLANANGGGGRDAERNHVSESDGVESDLMASLGDRAEACDKRGDEGEYARLRR